MHLDMPCILQWPSPALPVSSAAGAPCKGLLEPTEATPQTGGLQTARNALLALLQQAKQQARQQAQQATTPRGVAYALPPQQQAGGYRPQVSTLPLHSGVTLPSPTHTTASCPALVAVLNREMLL